MFKKTLAAAAILGAFAGSAFAADVTLYGVVDEGLLYKHTDLDNGKDATDNLTLNSGIQAASRFGLKGTEDLGNGLKVGFILENGFKADDGKFAATNNTLFDREASLSVSGAFGQVSLGKIGAITQGTSSWGKVGAVNAFGTSYAAANVANAGSVFSAPLTGVMNNTVAYQTPSFAGFKVYAQYSMDVDGKGVENQSSANRYYALGATYNNGPVGAFFAVDSINYKSFTADAGSVPARTEDMDDSLTVTFGGSYDFNVVKVFAGAQYFDEVTIQSVAGLKNVALTDDNNFKMKGYGLQASVSAPVAGGTAYFGAGYVDGSEADSVAKANKFDVSYWAASAGYKYDLSKRTNVYGVVSYGKADLDYAGTTNDREPSIATVAVGLRHNF